MIDIIFFFFCITINTAELPFNGFESVLQCKGLDIKCNATHLSCNLLFEVKSDPMETLQ